MGWSFVIALVAILLGFGALLAVIGVLRRRTGGGLGPTEFSDGSISAGPTGYPEDAEGSGKKISPTSNDAADYK